MYDEEHFTRDAAHVRFDADADGVTVDDEDVSFDWSEVETVRVSDPPHATAFDTEQFYRIPATVARPIPQPYSYGEDTVWLKKPREELKRSAWSLDNAPWTLGHPETGMVKDVDDVHGFWRDPQYDDREDDLDADLHVPVNDDEATEFLESNGDVSVGFHNRVTRVDDYDGIVGGSDADGVEIEGYQTDMMFDHVASVGLGRCPAEAGCGIDVDADVDSDAHGHVTPVEEGFKRDTRITNGSDDADGVDDGSNTDNVEDLDSMNETTDAPSGIYVADGTWFAVGPDEHPDDSTDWPDDAKFPVDNCADIEDAWNLRGTGDISIEQSTLEARIRRAAEAKDCDLPAEDALEPALVAESAKRYSVCGARKDVMDERDCGGCGGAEPSQPADGTDNADSDTETDSDDNDTTMEIEFDDLSTEAAIAKLEAKHDGASERLDELREATDEAEVAREAADELDLDDTSDLADAVSMREERIEELEERVDELQRPEMESDAEFIAEHTDRFGEDADEVIDNLDAEPEAIADKRELVEELTEEYDEQTANSGGGSSTDPEDTGGSGKYAKTPW